MARRWLPGSAHVRPRACKVWHRGAPYVASNSSPSSVTSPDPRRSPSARRRARVAAGARCRPRDGRRLPPLAAPPLRARPPPAGHRTRRSRRERRPTTPSARDPRRLRDGRHGRTPRASSPASFYDLRPWMHSVGSMLSAEQVNHFVTHGWVLSRVLDHAAADALAQWVDDVSSWPDDGGGWLHYREMTDDGPKLCRTENFVPFHRDLRELLQQGPMVEAASQLLGQPAVLYKEKINYKLPGGAGYAAHQDAPAYRFVDVHVSCMVAVDDALADNGCLEVVSGCHEHLLPTDDQGCIRAAVEASLTWAPVEVRAGETLWFHSRTPHRSGPNQSSTPRRALYPTYNALAEGDLREAYYRQKH